MLRVPYLLARILFLTLVVAGAVFLLARETLLFIAGYQLGSELDKVRILSRAQDNQEFTKKCAGLVVSTEQRLALSGFQLRFLNDTTYAVEAVCFGREKDPVFLRQADLPFQVRRAVGSPGAFFAVLEPAYAHIQIELWGRTHTIESRTSDLVASASPTYPTTSCGGWGYVCCDTITQLSTGTQPPGKVNDCSESCFTACVNRPVVLSFRADPGFDTASRTVLARGPEALVTLAFIVGNGSEKGIERAVLNYGDGQEDVYVVPQATAEHMYRCENGQRSCQFRATVQVIDLDGVVSPDVNTAELSIMLE
jgi:hypothetical protein